MDAATVVVMGVIVVVGMAAIVRSAARSNGGGAPEAESRGPQAVHVVTLDVTQGEPDDPSVQRLVTSLATRVFASRDDVRVVRVVRRDGAELGTVERPVGLAGDVADPATLRVPAAAHAHQPDPTDHERTHMPEVDLDAIEVAPPPPRAVAERFDLPASVASRLSERVTGVDLVRAVLEAGGHRVEVDDDLVRIGETAIIVVGGLDGRPIVAEDLSRAYLHFEASGAARGIEVCLGPYDHDDARRRQVMAPVLGHVGAEAIQRMADAVRLGGDPLAFVIEPAVA